MGCVARRSRCTRVSQVYQVILKEVFRLQTVRYIILHARKYGLSWQAGSRQSEGGMRVKTQPGIRTSRDPSRANSLFFHMAADNRAEMFRIIQIPTVHCDG